MKKQNDSDSLSQEKTFGEVAEEITKAGCRISQNTIRAIHNLSVARMARKLIKKTYGIVISPEEALALAKKPAFQEWVSDIFHVVDNNMKQKKVEENT